MLEDVFKAALGDREPLNALLRSNEPLSTRTRVALAMFLEGGLQPAKNPFSGHRKFKTMKSHDDGPFGRAYLYIEFGEMTADQAAEKALEETYPPGVVMGTKEQIARHWGHTPDKQRPKPPEPPYFFSSLEEEIEWDFLEYQRQIAENG